MYIGGRDVRLNERARANSVLCVKKKKTFLNIKRRTGGGEVWKEVYIPSWNQRKARMVLLILNKVDFREKNTTGIERVILKR